MGQKYLIRLDDACPAMNHAKWMRMEALLDKYLIKPMVGVIPNNEDPKQEIDNKDPMFWELVHNWEKKGWAIAMHGYNHVYSSKEGGMNPLWKKSEFAGHSKEIQKQKIRDGVSILRSNGINPLYFFAPSHTFDETTLDVLREESDIRIISDTISLRPYKYKDFVFIPQISGKCREMKIKGVYTFCFHPNTMTDSAFERTEDFLKIHKDEFVSFDKLNTDTLNRKSLIDRILSFIYFFIRKIKK
jgi:predicted deacetylase